MSGASSVRTLVLEPRPPHSLDRRQGTERTREASGAGQRKDQEDLCHLSHKAKKTHSNPVGARQSTLRGFWVRHTYTMCALNVHTHTLRALSDAYAINAGAPCNVTKKTPIFLKSKKKRERAGWGAERPTGRACGGARACPEALLTG